MCKLIIKKIVKYGKLHLHISLFYISLEVDSNICWLICFTNGIWYIYLTKLHESTPLRENSLIYVLPSHSYNVHDFHISRQLPVPHISPDPSFLSHSLSLLEKTVLTSDSSDRYGAVKEIQRCQATPLGFLGF